MRFIKLLKFFRNNFLTTHDVSCPIGVQMFHSYHARCARYCNYTTDQVWALAELLWRGLICPPSIREGVPDATDEQFANG